MKSHKDLEFNILDYIPIGQANAVKRKALATITGINDRYIRIAISEARQKTPILNLQNGKGYFVPDMDNPDDVKMLVRYVRQEESRLKSIALALRAARKALRNCGIDWRIKDE